MSDAGKMRYRLFGRSGLRVSDLCLGTMTFGNGQWGCGEDEAKRIYNRFRDAGGNFVDTANEMYAEGQSEEILGRLVAGHRDEIVIGTKYTFRMPGNGDVNAGGNHRKSMMRSVEGSLNRLGASHVDILWLHCWDGITPQDDVMRALDDLVTQGKVLAIGASNFPAWVVADANAKATRSDRIRYDAYQLEYNLVERAIEREHLPMARMEGMTVCAWSPLASGLLTGKYNCDAGDAARRLDTAPIRIVDDRGLKIAEGVAALAQEIGASSASVALAWLRAQPGVIPLLGARTYGQFADQLGCLAISLTADQLTRLNDVAAFKPGYPYDFIVRTQAIQTAGFHDLIDR